MLMLFSASYTGPCTCLSAALTSFRGGILLGLLKLEKSYYVPQPRAKHSLNIAMHTFLITFVPWSSNDHSSPCYHLQAWEEVPRSNTGCPKESRHLHTGVLELYLERRSSLHGGCAWLARSLRWSWGLRPSRPAGGPYVSWLIQSVGAGALQGTLLVLWWWRSGSAGAASSGRSPEARHSWSSL